MGRAYDQIAADPDIAALRNRANAPDAEGVPEAGTVSGVPAG